MLDVYNAAFRIPDFVYGLLLAAVSATTVVPFIAKAAKEDEAELREKFNSLFFFFGFGLAFISIAAVIILPFAVQFIVPGFDEFQRKYFVIASSILMVQPLFLGLSALVSSLAQVKHRFVLYSVAPLAYTLVIIVSIPLLYPRFGVTGISLGVVAGAMLNFLLQSYTLYETRMKLSLSMFRWEQVVSHMKIAVPRSMSTSVSNIRDIVFVSVATSFGVGVLSVYMFARRIIDAFVQVVVQSAATATLPHLAHKHADGEHESYARILKLNLLSIFAISAVAGIFISLFKDSIVHILYGQVSRAGEIANMARSLAYVLPLYAINIYFVTAFAAAKDTMGLFYANTLASIISVAVLFLSRAMGYGTFSIVIGSWALSSFFLLFLIIFYSRKKRLSRQS